MDLRSGILGAAQSLGVNPLDLATVISYETAGTFNPTIAGPTTQWGQHKGLIQFGEPQARQYGVDWNDPLKSQLGPDGAVVRYMREAGVQPGMGLLDLYSAVNAGRVGRYNASDANNGGAPGTVRDKVEDQMDGHRRKAAALFGGAGDDAMFGGDTPQGGQPMNGLLGMMSAQDEPEKPMRFGDRLRAAANDGSLWEGLALAANTLRMDPDPNINAWVAQRQGRREDARREQAGTAKEAQQRNETASFFEQMGQPDLAAAVRANVITGRDAMSRYWQMQQGNQDDLIEINGQLVNRRTREVVGDYRTQEPPNVDDIGQVRREYMGLDTTRDTMRAGTTFDTMVQAADSESGPGDIALVYNFMKMLDPASTVMQGEYATASNAGGVDQRLITTYNSILDGQKLSPEMRADFLKQAEQNYMARRGQNDQIRPQYQGMIEQLGGTGADLPQLPGMMPTDRAPMSSQRPQPRSFQQVPVPGMDEVQAAPQMDDGAAQRRIAAAVSQLEPMDRAILDSIPSPEGKIGFLMQKGLLQ